ncbi:MAG: alginate lyase family protein [Acidobacteriaceae bacterium]|nr:alginate lyase family protein [Acidobacteriaceae bacterium]
MLNRRQFLSTSAAAFALSRTLRSSESFDLAAIERPRVLKHANEFLKDKPVTVTASHSDRSAGGLHDYFSEGDYWWPDPKNPNGPYIQRDGMSNPGNFLAHREALLRLSVQAPMLCSAWVLTKDRKYAEKAADHLRAWFISKDTLMNANLQYAQAIHGRFTGRGIGIIDTLQLVDVVRGASAISGSGALSADELRAVHHWFADYLTWMTTSKNGIDEREAKNNHGSCWVLQAAVFATFTGNSDVKNFCRERLKTVLIPHQVAPDGSFPEELRRTKPYSYSLFNLEVLAGITQILSNADDNLWDFALPDGRSVAKAEAFMYPYMADKGKWPHPRDVMYFDQWPVREQSLLFAGLALKIPEYLALWRKLNPDPTVEEAIRNYPIRQPLLWMNPAVDRGVTV